ncbi:MAG: OmpH family outer membrane protein [Paraprevotella sp.]|nr:OmpH family outer membrane protein [Paraprevotella sp.]
MIKRVNKWLALIVISLFAQVVNAQEVQSLKFGFLSYNTLFQEMPEYQTAQQKLADLKAKYEKETQRSEAEFQRKYAEFLQGQKDFPENILLKRQYELQDLLAQSVKFKQEAQSLLEQAEKDLQADMLTRLNAAIQTVGLERGLAFVINIDGNACPFINTAMGEDVTDFVKAKLQNIP